MNYSILISCISDNEYFSVPLQIARRKLAGLRDSLVASSVWRPDFKNQLHKYPVLELSHLDFAIPACDACHLGKRMSTLLGRVSGAPYDRLGFQVGKGLIVCAAHVSYSIVLAINSRQFGFRL